MNRQTRLNKMIQHIVHSFKIQDLMEKDEMSSTQKAQP